MIPNSKPRCLGFKRTGLGENQKCFMVCNCGAEIEIESFRHSWSIIETRVRWAKHLEEAHQTEKDL